MSQLIFRPWLPSDLDELARIANDYLVSRYLTQVFPFPYTKQDAELFIARKEKFCIALKHLPFVPIGGCGIHQYATEHSVGYWLGRAYWGKGFGQQIGKFITNFALENSGGVPITAKACSANLGSMSILQKAGFIAVDERMEVHRDGIAELITYFWHKHNANIA